MDSNTKQIVDDSLSTFKHCKILKGCQEVDDFIVDNIPDLPVFGSSPVNFLFGFLASSILQFLALLKVPLSQIQIGWP